MTPQEYLEVGRRPDGKPLFSVRLLAMMANWAGIQFHVGGWPYGASYQRAVNHSLAEVESDSEACRPA